MTGKHSDSKDDTWVQPWGEDERVRNHYNELTVNFRENTSCKGDVWLFTDEGDKFNLKSKLSQITGLLKLVEGGKLVEAKLYCSNLEDEAYLFRLNLFGSVEEVDKIQ